MSSSPYQGLPDTAFWRSGVAEASPLSLRGLYTKKWPIRRDWKIATAGSCFAQHVSRHMMKNGYNVLDVEPPPRGLPAAAHAKFGYGMYSARYGNIYTVRQLLQLAREVIAAAEPGEIVWEADGRYFDALRPAVEPDGLDSPDEVRAHRSVHLARVREMFRGMDVFIFTLGLTEAWVHMETETVFPTAPGTIAGEFDAGRYAFRNFTFMDIVHDFVEFQRILRDLRDGPELRFILTVSPVPLTATASGRHVLQASTYSKSVLRAVAGYLSDRNAHIDYFPSYEIITNQAARGIFFENNLRSIADEGVEVVMKTFFLEHPVMNPAHDFDTAQAGAALPTADSAPEEDVQCEEALLEAFLP